MNDSRSMGRSAVPVLHVEDGGKIIRGLALPFHEPAVIVESADRWFEEIMDEESVTSIASNLPLLVSHDRDKPAAGIVRNTSIWSRGVGVEAKLVGSDDELEGWRRRFRHGLSAGLSIGFARNRNKDIYELPLGPGRLPVVRRRGIEIVEVSLVMWPAYSKAGITSLSVRSAADELRHEESERTMVETQRFLARRSKAV